jgi:nitrate reductase delta subunit
MLVFKAFSALLSYPTPELREALPEIAALIRATPLVAAAERDALLALVAEIGRGELLEAEERYVALFDHSRALSLHLFEHLYGESRERGEAMAALRRLYERAGLTLRGRELPDFLPVVLEYLSCRPPAEARQLLAECAPILARLARALMARRSAYAAVPQALLVIAGAAPIAAATVPPAAERPEILDRDWAEPPAFAAAAPARAE